MSSHHRNQPLVRTGQPPYERDYYTQPYSIAGLIWSLAILTILCFLIAGVLAYVN